MAKLFLMLACLACEGHGQPAQNSRIAKIRHRLNAPPGVTMFSAGIKSLAALFLEFNPAQACSPSAPRRRCLEHSALVKPTFVGTPIMMADTAVDIRPLRWKQAWVSEPSSDEKPSLVESLSRSVLCIENVASEADRRLIVEASLPAAQKYRKDDPLSGFGMSEEEKKKVWKLMGGKFEKEEVAAKLELLGLKAPAGSSGLGDGGMVRLSDITIPSEAEDKIKESILPRFFKIFDAMFPDAAKELFGGAASLGELYSSGKLSFAMQEPAIHVLTPGGVFEPEEKGQTLSVLIPLSHPYRLEGDGFGFWSPLDSDSEGFDKKPNLCLQPPAGTAMVFGGKMPHAYIPLQRGEQVILAASFSLQE